MFVSVILTDLREKQDFLISNLHILFSPLVATSNVKFSREKVVYEEERGLGTSGELGYLYVMKPQCQN